MVSHIFCPLRTKSPDAERVAFDRIAATSEPQPGSDIENAPRTSPVAIRGSRVRFCSAEPCCAMR